MKQDSGQRVLIGFVRMAEHYANMAAAGIVRDSGLKGIEAAELMDVASKLYAHSIVAASGLTDVRVAEAFEIMRRPHEGGKKIPIRDSYRKMHVQYPHQVTSESGRLSPVGM